MSTRKDSKYKFFVGFIIAGAIITAIGLYAAFGRLCRIMGNYG